MTTAASAEHQQKAEPEPTSGNLDDIATSLLSFQTASVEALPVKRSLQFLLNESQADQELQITVDRKRARPSELEPESKLRACKPSSTDSHGLSETVPNLKFHLQPIHAFQHYYSSQHGQSAQTRAPLMHAREPEHGRSYSLPASTQYYFQTLSARDMQPESSRLNKMPSYVQIRPQRSPRDASVHPHSRMTIRSLCSKIDDTGETKEQQSSEPAARRSSGASALFNLLSRVPAAPAATTTTTGSRVLLPNLAPTVAMSSALPSSCASPAPTSLLPLAKAAQEPDHNRYLHTAMRSHSFCAPGHASGTPLQQIALPSTTYGKSLAFANYPATSAYTKAKRKRLSPYQINVLENVFNHTYFPSTELRVLLGKQLGLSSRTIQIWFQNKRQSWRSRVRHETEDSELAYRMTSREMEFHRLRRGAELNSLIDHEIIHRSNVGLEKPSATEKARLMHETETEEDSNDEDRQDSSEDSSSNDGGDDGSSEKAPRDWQKGKDASHASSSDSEPAQNENTFTENGNKIGGSKLPFDPRLNDQIQQLLKEEETRCRLLPLP